MNQKKEAAKKAQVPPAANLSDPHYPIRFFAERWNLSDDTIRRWFRDLPGVLKVGEKTRGKRAKILLRIPLSLAEREYREKTK